jgi:two-component system sensor histidine kinase MprB
VTTSDELGRLATRFNAMLVALEESVGKQRRLVADASHELRTPLTAARTNVDLLREGKLGEEDARRAVDEASVELAALSTLVADLAELARGQERKLRVEEVHLDELVAEMIERAKRARQAMFVTALSRPLSKADAVLVEPRRLEPARQRGEIQPAGRRSSQRPRTAGSRRRPRPRRGGGNLPRIFDRFYRSATARSKPGAGLGLAIVREAARAGGTATVESGAGGARFRLTLPATI